MFGRRRFGGAGNRRGGLQQGVYGGDAVVSRADVLDGLFD